MHSLTIQIVQVSNSNPLLGVYAALQQSGSLALLVVNKSPLGAQTVAFSIAGFATGSIRAAVYTYGKAQDTASSDSTFCSLGVTSPSIRYTFQPYSITVLVISAASP